MNKVKRSLPTKMLIYDYIWSFQLVTFFKENTFKNNAGLNEFLKLFVLIYLGRKLASKDFIVCISEMTDGWLSLLCLPAVRLWFPSAAHALNRWSEDCTTFLTIINTYQYPCNKMSNVHVQYWWLLDFIALLIIAWKNLCSTSCLYLRWVRSALMVSRTEGPTLASMARDVKILERTVAIPHLTYK